MVAVQSALAPPKHRVGDIMRAHAAEYLHLRPTTPRQRQVLRALASCRTEALGGFVAACDSCDYRRIVYNPCRDRHCPSCEGQAAQDWLEELRGRLPPCRYFHVVFTLPAQLRWLAFQNGALVYGLLLRTAGETLSEVATDPKYLGAQLGVTAVLHTWRRDLQLHPHVHCLVTAGGLSPDGTRWVPSLGERYLAPTRLLAARFRDNLLHQLSGAQARGELRFAGDCAALQDPTAFARLMAEMRAKSWLVYAKAAFKDLDHLLRYLGRYTHRVGISDRRLLEINDDFVTFATKGGETAELRVFAFLDRFLLHVLPHAFVKIRHYGLFASASRRRLAQACALLEADDVPEDDSSAPDSDQEPRDPTSPCPQCMFGTLTRQDLPNSRTKLPRPHT